METVYNDRGEPLIVGDKRDKILNCIDPIIDILEANPEDIKLYREYPFINSFHFSHKNLDIGTNISQPRCSKILLFYIRNISNKINDKKYIDEFSVEWSPDIGEALGKMDHILDNLETLVDCFISQKGDDLKKHVEYLKQEEPAI